MTAWLASVGFVLACVLVAAGLAPTSEPAQEQARPRPHLAPSGSVDGSSSFTRSTPERRRRAELDDKGSQLPGALPGERGGRIQAGRPGSPPRARVHRGGSAPKHVPRDVHVHRASRVVRGLAPGDDRPAESPRRAAEVRLGSRERGRHAPRGPPASRSA